VHWLATQDPDLRSWQGVASIKKAFDRSRYVSAAARIIPATSTADHDDDPYTQLDAEVTAYVDTLHAAAYLMAEMFAPTAAFAAFKTGRERAQTASAALARTNTVAPHRPLLCAARLAYPDDGDFYADLVAVLEKYSARVFVILQRRANAGQPKLTSLAYDLFHKRCSKQDVLDAVAVLQWRYAPDAQVRAALESDNENWYVRRGHKYFLYEYELSQMGAGEQIPDFGFFLKKGNEQRTTEHILPQTPDADAECWWGKFTEEEHVGLRHALGNLVLTLDNSSYSNNCFDKKRGAPLSPGSTPTACYAQSSLHQERELALFEEWTPDAIRKRQQTLADWALGRWAVAVPGADMLEPEDSEPDIESEGDELDLVVSDTAAPEDASSTGVMALSALRGPGPGGCGSGATPTASAQALAARFGRRRPSRAQSGAFPAGRWVWPSVLFLGGGTFGGSHTTRPRSGSMRTTGSWARSGARCGSGFLVRRSLSQDTRPSSGSLVLGMTHSITSTARPW
jgi:hypothetical protein